VDSTSSPERQQAPQRIAGAVDQRDAAQRAVLAALRWLVSTTRLMSKVKWKKTFFALV